MRRFGPVERFGNSWQRRHVPGCLVYTPIADHHMKRSAGICIATALMAALVLPAALAGQGVFKPDTAKQPGAKTWLVRKAALPPYHPPRTADGQPNLQGSWGAAYSGDIIEETEYVDRTTPPVE